MPYGGETRRLLGFEKKSKGSSNSLIHSLAKFFAPKSHLHSGDDVDNQTGERSNSLDIWWDLQKLREQHLPSFLSHYLKETHQGRCVEVDHEENTHQ
jgi:hypothetical protein